MFKQRFFLTIFAISQLFFVYFVASGVLPEKLVYFNLILQLGVLLVFDLEYALYSVIISIPFYLAIPNSHFDSLSSWRFVILALFAVFAYKNKIWQARFNWIRSKWDKYLFWLLLVILLSIYFESFKTVGIKKLFFVVNVYLLYVLIRNIIRTREQIIRSLFVTFSSVAAIVLLGYLQFIVTFKTTTYYFWQYWATLISRAYYGATLSDSLTYSNSWFSFYKNAPPSLRMFSILPDSHAFALIAIFSLPLASALLYFVVSKTAKVLLWIFIGLAALSIDLSGTRGAWVGILAPLLALLFLYYKHYGRKLIGKMFIPIILFLFFLIVSPFLQKAFNLLQKGYNSGNFITRAESVYDLGESSNAGRIKIWKQSLSYAISHPILGTGFGNFIVIVDPNQHNYQAAAVANDRVYNLPNKYITAHSLYLDFLVETGFVGLILLIAYFSSILKSAWIFLKEKYLYSEDGLVYFAVCFALYLLWVLAYSFFDGTLINDRVLMYFFIEMAIMASILQLSSKDA